MVLSADATTEAVCVGPLLTTLPATCQQGSNRPERGQLTPGHPNRVLQEQAPPAQRGRREGRETSDITDVKRRVGGDLGWENTRGKQTGGLKSRPATESTSQHSTANSWVDPVFRFQRSAISSPFHDEQNGRDKQTIQNTIPAARRE